MGWMNWMKNGIYLLIHMICWALLAGLLLFCLNVEERPAKQASDRAAMVAAAQKYDAAMEEYGDPAAADALAQQVYIRLGGTREYWQGVAE